MPSVSSESAVVCGTMEPTITGVANMPAVSEIAAWCYFEESDDLAVLLTLLGAKATTKTSIFAAIPEPLLEWTFQKWRLPSGDSPSPVLQAKAGLMGAVARLTQDRRAERQKAMELEELKARAKLTAVTTADAAPAQCVDSARQMIKLSSVVDQADDREVRPFVPGPR